MSFDDLILSLQRALDRLIRRFRRGGAPPVTHRRFVVVQIDGLSRAVLERGLASGHMPFLISSGIRATGAAEPRCPVPERRPAVGRRIRRAWTRAALPDGLRRMESTQTRRLTEDLRRELSATHVEVRDDSAAHVGHAGAGEGGHYAVVVVSAVFEGRDLLARHRAVYAALGDLAARGVHGLALSSYTPEEWRASGRGA